MKKEKTIKKSVTVQPETLKTLLRRSGNRENGLSSQVNNDLRLYHALMDLLAMEAMVESRFSEGEVLLLLRSTDGMVVEPGRLASIAMRITGAIAEQTRPENHQAMSALAYKIRNLSMVAALWLWDAITVYRANSQRHQDREYLLALFGVR